MFKLVILIYNLVFNHKDNLASVSTIDTVRSMTTPSGFTNTVKFNSNRDELKDKMLISISDQTKDIKFIGERE